MKKIIINLNLIRSIPAILTYLLVLNKIDIQHDIKRWEWCIPYRNKTGILALNYLLVLFPEFRNIFYYRVKEKSSILEHFLYIFYRPLRDILIGGNIGNGFMLFHGYSSCIAVNTAGKNFSVYQQVTVGKNPKSKDICPTIGDNVSIYAGAIVVGDIKIGNNVEIGAGSVVTKDIPSNCVVVGNPARIIKRDGVAVNENL